MTILLLTKTFFRLGIIFTLFTTVLGAKCCHIIRKFQDTKSPPGRNNFLFRCITVYTLTNFDFSCQFVLDIKLVVKV